MNTVDPRTRNIIIIVVVVIAVCCLCCLAAFIGQYFLQNSNFSLV